MLAVMRFVHTADWQIGKPFRAFGDRESLLHKARLDAIDRLGQLAVTEAALHVLVAGDLYDTDAPSLRTLREPVERMRRFPSVQWHIIPGNHDPHRASGVWDWLRRDDLPGNIRLHLSAGPVDMAPGAVLLPAPLTRRSETRDLTDWMDTAATPEGALRIGLAHGSVQGFGSGEGEAGNPIAPDRAGRAGLDYLALGDWHRTLSISSATWYAGTPEPDRFGSQERGQALLVEIASPGATPKVTPVETGTFAWLTREEHLAGADDIAALQGAVRALPDPGRTVLRLRLEGALGIAERTILDDTLERIAAGLAHLQADIDGVVVRPSADDLEAIDFGGVLREAAERLKARAVDETLDSEARRRAGDALVELYLRAVAQTETAAGADRAA
jgi:DNA repair exonuclease SbcCD nuclease subunit